MSRPRAEMHMSYVYLYQRFKYKRYPNCHRPPTISPSKHRARGAGEYTRFKKIPNLKMPLTRIGRARIPDPDLSNPGARTSARWLGVPRNLIPVRTSGCRMENSGCCLRSPSLSLVCFTTFQQNRLRARVLCRLWAEPCQGLYRRVCMCPS